MISIWSFCDQHEDCNHYGHQTHTRMLCSVTIKLMVYIVPDHSNVGNLDHSGRKHKKWKHHTPFYLYTMVFLYCNLQNIILGLRTEAVVKKGDGDTLSDWKPAFAWHRWNFCDHQDDQWSSSNCLWSQRWSTRRLFTSSVMIIKRDHIIDEAECHGAVFTNILSILCFLHLST